MSMEIAEAREALAEFANRLDACPEDTPDIAYAGIESTHGEVREIRKAIRALVVATMGTGKRDVAAEQLRDDIIDLITPLHWEAWKAGLFTSQEEWPDDEQQEYLASCVDGVAVGEHFQAWGDEVADKLAALLARHPAFLPMDQWDKRDESVLLLVDYSEGDHPLDDATVAITIGHNNDHNVGDGEGQGWLFAGWCWTHDHYVQGAGTPIGLMPIPHHLAALFASKLPASEARA